MPKAADLSQFNVKARRTPAVALEPVRKPDAAERKLITKGFRVTPEAAHQFNILGAELGKDDPKNTGPKLIAEALNWLFTKYGKPPIA